MHNTLAEMEPERNQCKTEFNKRFEKNLNLMSTVERKIQIPIFEKNTLCGGC